MFDTGVVLKINDAILACTIAREEEELLLGLTGLDVLPADHGMLFDLGEPAPTYFWNKEVCFPVDIAFADEMGKIVAINQMEAFQQDYCLCFEHVCWALETNVGWLERNNITIGDMIDVIPLKETKNEEQVG